MPYSETVIYITLIHLYISTYSIKTLKTRANPTLRQADAVKSGRGLAAPISPWQPANSSHKSIRQTLAIPVCASHVTTLFCLHVAYMVLMVLSSCLASCRVQPDTSESYRAQMCQRMTYKDGGRCKNYNTHHHANAIPKPHWAHVQDLVRQNEWPHRRHASYHAQIANCLWSYINYLIGITLLTNPLFVCRKSTSS